LKIKIPENLTQQVYRLIRDEILQGKLNSQKRLTEEFFAKTFGISKSPIREALNRLEADGLIKIRPRRGAFVVDFSLQDIREIYEMREILEACVVRSVTLDQKTIAALRESVDTAEANFRKREKLNYIRADATFHQLLARACNNSRVRKAIESMHDQTIILRHSTFELANPVSITEHRQILSALEQGKNEKAERFIIEHIRGVRDRLLKRLAAGENRVRAKVVNGSEFVPVAGPEAMPMKIPAKPRLRL
jgi:DNA-binding GntR family transcriptional regulator